ncbi:hypothetical protein [Allorhodopirellula solitaria]|uniref:Uncharacterized protein n=1 Tax=Allorhodopirellula solitaria TaxID=2527987 RepID=A0A5C5WNI9_9BACT|nr:hypothetical protein [Allorhodopirellula solitaria]TWT51659.1 hypothetical protein CA85_52290 [Allorhodopirellula solitaria]
MAFPGFFPPLELCGKDVGAKAGEFDRHSFTDGGSYDNTLLVGLSEVSRTEELYRIPAFQSLTLADEQAQAKLRQIVASGQDPDVEERVWLNCELASAALRRANGKPCIQSGPNELDEILVSDAGASFKVRPDGRAGGLLNTALWSTDILMDRVNQLESGSFEDTAGLLFFPITRLVRESDDSTAPHPEIQRQAALIRTDMDRFSELEISSLIQHGYCVARQVFRESGGELSKDLPDNPPWDPLGNQFDLRQSKDRTVEDAQQVLPAARILQRSSARRTSARQSYVLTTINSLSIAFPSTSQSRWSWSKRP